MRWMHSIRRFDGSRLVIGVVTCGVMLAILATVGGVTKAHADKAFPGADCGRNNSANYATAANPTFVDAGVYTDVYIYWTQKCGASTTSVEAELQYSYDGGNTWHDYTTAGTNNPIDNIYQTGASHAGVVWHRTSGFVITCDSSNLFRTHVWIANAATNPDDASAGVHGSSCAA